jgi:hypothetical protein
LLLQQIKALKPPQVDPARQDDPGKTKGSGVNAIRIVRNSAPPRALGRLAREAASCEDGVVQRHLSQEATDGCRFDSCSAAA